ncbi:MAG: GNAT family N-acetyltransferase [Euryarchaeota archaeon]|nr:GNAT family N-acetyltransferase [Euryarchaeota archaeon]
MALRPPAPEDLPLLFRWLNDPDAIAPWDRFEVDSFDALREALREAPQDPRSLAPRFLITEVANERPVGVVGFFNSYTALDTVDLWYAICIPEERGKGYGRESVNLLTDYVFAHRPVERVGATSDVENPSSWKMLDHLGFRREGTMRQALFHHGAWHDVAVYGLTRTEWRTLRSPPGKRSRAPG